jgi:hypothetical protein
MSPAKPDTFARLRAANPAPVDDNRSRTEVAQAALQRILDDPIALADSGLHARVPYRQRGRSSSRLALTLVAVVVGGGSAAFAAADPLGWWSGNPSEAMYGAAPASHVKTPTAEEIRCGPRSVKQFRCFPSDSGQRYSRIDTIRPPASISRAEITAYITKRLEAGRMSAAEAAKFNADLAAVPDSFFSEFEVASRFGTYGGGGEIRDGRTLVPPARVPEFLVCEDAGTALSCQDLNGDHAAPLGAGVYMADPAADWRPSPAHRRDSTLPPGINFTSAEYKLLIDMVKNGTVTKSLSSSGRSVPARRPRPTERSTHP